MRNSSTSERGCAGCAGFRARELAFEFGTKCPSFAHSLLKGMVEKQYPLKSVYSRHIACFGAQVLSDRVERGKVGQLG